jgi:hypothetical protein
MGAMPALANSGGITPWREWRILEGKDSAQRFFTRAGVGRVVVCRPFRLVAARKGVTMPHSQFDRVALWIVLMMLIMVPWILEFAGYLK